MVFDFQRLVPLLLVVSSILAIVANSLLLLVFFKRRGLRTISNRFVINLLVTNLISSVVLIPLLVVNDSATAENTRNSTNISEVNEVKLAAIYKTNIVETAEFIEIDIVNDRNLYEGDQNLFLCYFSRIATNLVCVSSIFGILLIGLDQYFAVIHPLRYHSYINKSKSLILLISVWGFSIFVASLDLLVNFSNFWRFCPANLNYFKLLEVVYASLYFSIIILAPFLTICAIYFKIYFAARESSARMRKSNSSGGNSYCNLPIRDETLKPTSIGLPRIHSAPNMSEFERVEPKRIVRSISDRMNTNIIVSLKTKISNASVFRYREETRAARISVLVIFVVFVCYFPYGTTIIINSYRGEISYSFNFVSIVLLILSNIISPFLFAYRNRRIQRELIKLVVPKFLAKKKKIKTNEIRTETRIPKESQIPKVVVTLNTEQEKSKSILKRVCSKTWNYKKCNFISVPDSCLEPRASFSSASTQVSTTEDF